MLAGDIDPGKLLEAHDKVKYHAGTLTVFVLMLEKSKGYFSSQGAAPVVRSEELLHPSKNHMTHSESHKPLSDAVHYA